MSFDAFGVAAMAAELRTMLLQGRVQRVSQINSLTFGFEIYVYPERRYLVISVEPQAPHLHLTMEKTRRGAGNPTPLMLVLRKYMRGAILTSIEQPPHERLLYFHFKGLVGPLTLALEMIGTHSNLLLLEADETILGVARLPKSSRNKPTRGRQLLPNHPYEPPPPQDKINPEALTEYMLRQEVTEASPKFALSRLLPQVVRGVSPFLAREIIYRATGNPKMKVGELESLSPLLAASQQIFARLEHDDWQPHLAFDEDESPQAFAPYPITHLPHSQPMPTMSEAVQRYFADAAGGYAAAKAPLREAIAEAQRKLERRRMKLAEDATARQDPELLKQKGEAILAYAHAIEVGQSKLSAPWTPGQPPLEINLDSTLSAPENAQQYFNRYRKALRAAEAIPQQRQQIKLEENYLEQVVQDLEMADDRAEIDAVAGALAAAGYYRPKLRRKRRYRARPKNYLRLTAPDGAKVLVGKNADQNAYLTFKRASGDDIWLHAHKMPGAHVIVPTAEGLPSEEDVFWAASVAAYFSKARHDTSVDVDVTLKKYVRPVKGGPPGLVTYRNESTLHVTPEAPEIE